jgi:hypothetical protein
MTGGSGSGITKVMVKSVAQKRSSRHRQSGQWLTVVVGRTIRTFSVGLHPGGAFSVVTTAMLSHFDSCLLRKTPVYDTSSVTAVTFNTLYGYNCMCNYGVIYVLRKFAFLISQPYKLAFLKCFNNCTLVIQFFDFLFRLFAPLNVSHKLLQIHLFLVGSNFLVCCTLQLDK